MLKLHDVSAQYGQAKVLHHVSIEVKEGEIVAIVGSNGAGKSTLVKAITGLIQPTAGKVLFNDRDITALPAHEIYEMGIAQVMERRRLFPDMTVLENLLIGGASKRALPHREESLRYVYELFPILKERAGQRAKTLSGGQQQMVAIGRALMGRPSMLILDEPSIGLAPVIVKEVFQAIQTINKQGVTVLLNEQNVKRSLSICHHAYVLENGKIVLEGTGLELLHDEKTMKAYIGV